MATVFKHYDILPEAIKLKLMLVVNQNKYSNTELVKTLNLYWKKTLNCISGVRLDNSFFLVN